AGCGAPRPLALLAGAHPPAQWAAARSIGRRAASSGKSERRTTAFRQSKSIFPSRHRPRRRFGTGWRLVGVVACEAREVQARQVAKRWNRKAERVDFGHLGVAGRLDGDALLFQQLLLAHHVGARLGTAV